MPCERGHAAMPACDKGQQDFPASTLTLGELEALACFGTSRFLTFNNARVAGHEAFGTEGFLILGVDFNQCAGNGETESLGLAFVTAAVEVYTDVVFFNNVEGLEGLGDDVLENRRGEILVECTVVDSDFAVAFGNDNAGDGCFTTAYCIYCFHI